MIHPKKTGEITEIIIISEFIKRGIPVLQPFGDNQRYDLVVDAFNKLYRVQCKTGRYISGSIEIPLRSVRWNSKQYTVTTYVGQIDLFAAYFQNVVYIIPIDKVLDYTGSFRLRLEPTTQNVNLAKDYELDTWLESLMNPSPPTVCIY